VDQLVHLSAGYVRVRLHLIGARARDEQARRNLHDTLLQRGYDDIMPELARFGCEPDR
jgi:hypothetical protein